MPDYQEAFHAALEWTEKQGLIVPQTYFTEDRFLNEKNMEQLTIDLKPLFKAMVFEEFKTKALSLHQDLQEMVEDILECPVFYTIGCVRVGRDDYFKLTHETISKSLSSGRRNKLQLHAWLTFPSMEIIDFSINSILSEILHQADIAGKILAAHPSHFGKGLVFQPLLVGDDFLRKTRP